MVDPRSQMDCVKLLGQVQPRVNEGERPEHLLWLEGPGANRARTMTFELS